jgi:hypothetical protein
VAAVSVLVTMLPDDRIAVRDSKQGDNGRVLRFSEPEWEAFTEDVKSGRLTPWRLRTASAQSK